MKKPALQPFIDDLLANQAPPWQAITSRELTRRLGVSLQTMANWRVRDTGPEHERAPRGVGNKILYCPDVVASWLSGGLVPAWEFTAAWLERRGMAPVEWTEAATRDVVARLEQFDIFASTYSTKW